MLMVAGGAQPVSVAKPSILALLTLGFSSHSHQNLSSVTILGCYSGLREAPQGINPPVRRVWMPGSLRVMSYKSFANPSLCR